MADKMGRLAIYLQLLFLGVFICTSLADIEMDANVFKTYRFLKQKTTQKNHIKLRFKTIHSTGLIMFARGANKKDFLSVELYRGKIRVAGDYGRGTENKLRPIAGFYDMYLGKDLADNKWHTVEVIRNIRESIIYIDRGLGKMEKSMFMKSPPTYNELSVSMVTFGGFYSYATSELSSSQALSRKGLKACFSEATFSQYWPEDDNKEINFLSKDVQDMEVVGGNVVDYCADMTPPYKPMFFSSPAVHIGLVEKYKQKAMKLSLKFRTVVSDIILANYTKVNSGETLQLRLNRKGKVEIQFEFSKVTQIVETARENYHDGQWHSASYEIDNAAIDPDKDFIIKFTVDGKTRLSKMGREFPFDGSVNVGFGFTGCMRDILINDHDIYRLPRGEENQNDYFRVSDIGVVHNSCSLKDYCNPNPCQNGGRCNQTEDNIICDCKGTLYEGSTCHRPRFNYTCAGIRKAGVRRSDVYYIDMDGMGPMKPVRALCDLGKTVDSTVTQINNTKVLDLNVLTDSGTNEVDIEYQASITQMRELIKNSASCLQFVKYQCKGTPMFQSPAGPPMVSWMGGDDIVHFYWGGAMGKRGYCACGVRGDCKVGNKFIGKYCNCDSLLSKQQIIDEGNFTIKEHLPVRQVKFKKVLKGERSEGNLRVGHLRCAGFGAHSIAATFRKPWSYLGMDHPDQPFDNIFAGGISLEFKTTIAYNYMTLVHAHGPFSGDYCKVMIWSKTMVRVLLNFGFGEIKQDVDIVSTGRTFDDNQWHEFSLMFNLKELNVTLDGIEMIQGLPLQEDPVQFNVDDKAVYVGGSYHDKNGFIGCIRSFYVNGRIHDIYTAAEGMEDQGVYQGCGAACEVLNKPCNYGYCIDYYDSLKCNCSVSPYHGHFCQNSTKGKSFSSGNSIVYDFIKANKSEPVNTGIFVVGFKTTSGNVALAQLKGKDYRHFTLVLDNDGFLVLYYSMKKKLKLDNNFETDTDVVILKPPFKEGLNDNKHHVVRVEFTTDHIFLEIPDLKHRSLANVTERTVKLPNGFDSLEQYPDVFEIPVKFTVGSAESDIKTGRTFPSSFTGCMSGAKIVLHPRATRSKPFRKSIELDLFELTDSYSERNEGDNNDISKYLTGSIPPSGSCGGPLSTPGPIPTVGGPSQFFTKSPGLDSVRVSTVDLTESVTICVVIVIIAIILLGFLFMTYKYVNKSHIDYRSLRNQENPKSVRMKEFSSQPPPASYNQPPPASYNQPPPVSYNQPPSASYNQPPPTAYNQGGGGEDNWFL